MRPSGSQASGEIGRMNLDDRIERAVEGGDRPSRKPSGVPIAIASAKPLATRTRLREREAADALVHLAVLEERLAGRSARDSCHVRTATADRARPSR